MQTNNYLPDVLETTEPERLATGFIFTEARSGIRTATGTSLISVGTSCFV